MPYIHEDEKIWQGLCDGLMEKRPEGYSAIILDTAGRVLAGTNENSQEFVSLLSQRVRLIQEALDCVVIVVHHSGHDSKDRERGSSVFQADSDTRLKISQPSKGLAKLEMMKQKMGLQWEKPYHLKLASITLPGDKMQVAVDHADQSQIDRSTNIQGAAKIGMANDIREEVINILNATSGEVAYTQRKLAQMVSDNTGIGFSTAKKHISEWHADKDDPTLKNQYKYHAKTQSGKKYPAYRVFNFHGEK